MSQSAVVKPSSGAYEVARARGQCALCQVQVEPGGPLMAGLRENATGFERVDCCLACWPEFDKSGLAAFWRTTLRQAEQKKKLFVDDEVLCQLFERLAEAQEPAKVNFRFVLGLILMRKRLLIYEDSGSRDNVETWSVRFKGREDRLELVNPRLDEAQIQDVTAQLGEILNEEL